MKRGSIYLKFLRRTGKDQQGLALVEMVLALPFLLLMFLGAVDFTNMLIIQQKMDRVSFTLADLTTQHGQVSGIAGQLNQWQHGVAGELMRPYYWQPSRYIVQVGSFNDQNFLEWFYRGGRQQPTGRCRNNVGAQANFVLPAVLAGGRERGERTIMARVQYRYDPLLPGMARAIRVLNPRLRPQFRRGITFNKTSYMQARTNNTQNLILSRC